MRAAERAAALLVATAACTDARPVRLDAPPEIAWVALVTDDAASPLVRWSVDEPLPAHVASDETLHILGFTDAQIGALVVRPGTSIEGERLTFAEGCTRRLPSPTWHVELRSDDGVTSRAPSDAPALTAGWLGCPEDDVIVHANCLPLPCALGRITTSGCALRVDLTQCIGGSGVLVGERQADGTLCFESNPWSCVPDDPITPELTGYVCPASCRTSVFAAPARAPFELARIDVTGGALYLPGELTIDFLVPNNRLHSGKAYDLALVGDRAVVAHTGGLGVEFCPNVPDVGPTSLSFYDLETLAPAGTATAPECLTRLLGDADELVGVHGARGEPVLSRFDHAGRVVASSPPAEGVMRAASAPEQIVAELVRVGEPAELAVLYEWLEARPGGTDLGYILYAYDPDSLAVRHADWVQDRRTFAITPIGTSTLAIAEEKYQHVEYFDVRTRRVTRRVSLPASSASVRYDMTSIAQAPGTGRILTTTPLDLASVRMVDRDEAFGLTMPFERIVFPTSVHPWPADVDVLIVGGVAPDADGTYDAVVMFYDTRHARFLPGTWPIGQGAVTRMLTDRAGRVWALLPWAGEVVRLTPG